jgi:transcriptional regulator with XRE-family HTH domain
MTTTHSVHFAFPSAKKVQFQPPIARITNMPAPIPAGLGLGHRLRQLRQERNMTQQDLAKASKAHYTHISRYEADKSLPAADTLRRLADALGTTVDFLMDGATQDNAKTRLNDKALLQRFQEVANLPDDKKATIMELMDAFLAMNQLKNYTNRQAG